MNDYSILIACAAGLVLGVLISLLFAKYFRNNSMNNSLFGMDINVFMTNLLMFSVILAIVIFSTLSYLVKDLTYPRENPVYFTLETLFSAFVPSSMFYAILFLRGIPATQHRNIEYILLSAKFGLLHILFQFSGFYTYAFSG
jgi:ABC-type uncharacterized transport system permease subunit